VLFFAYAEKAISYHPRLAALANERGDKINACLILKDGLKEFPNSTEIKGKIEAFQCDKSGRN
jgi:hypothetical protein